MTSSFEKTLSAHNLAMLMRAEVSRYHVGNSSKRKKDYTPQTRKWYAEYQGDPT